MRIENMLNEFTESIDKINTLAGEVWFWWGIGIILLYPFLLIVINELAHRLNKGNVEFLHIVIHVRNIVLPVFLLYILLAKILLLPDSNIALKIVKTTFWVLLIYFILKTVNTILFSEAFRFQERIPKLLVDFIRAFLVLFGVALVAADVWGADLGKLLAALGMGSLVLGLALQDVLGGLFSGIALLSARPFSVGDWIRVGGIEGQVKSVDWRAVSLETKDKYLVMIPNAVIAKREFENFSKPTPMHRMNVNIDFSIEHPPNQVIQVLLAVIKNIPEILKNPKPNVYLSSYNTVKALAHYEIHYFISNYENKDDAYKLLMSQIWYVNQRENLRFHSEQPSYPLVTTDEILAKLKTLSVFDISDENRTQLAQNAKIENYGVHERILTKNSIVTRFYIIVDGIAEQRNEATEYNKNQPIATHRLTTGDFFGFSGMVSNENYGEIVVAMTDLTVIAIKIEALRKMLQRNPLIADGLESVVKARSGFDV
jgi:small-conductance mechanosensitive channel